MAKETVLPDVILIPWDDPDAAIANFPESVPLTVDFDYEKTAGTVKLSRDEFGNIVGEVHMNRDWAWILDENDQDEMPSHYSVAAVSTPETFDIREIGVIMDPWNRPSQG